MPSWQGDPSQVVLATSPSIFLRAKLFVRSEMSLNIEFSTDTYIETRIFKESGDNCEYTQIVCGDKDLPKLELNLQEWLRQIHEAMDRLRLEPLPR